MKVFIILITTLLLLFLLNRDNKVETFKNKDLYAIHTVFIARENILFLEEWIDYHIQLGFNKFYLYDNSKVELKSNFDSKNKKIKPGKVNKYNINFNELVDLSDNEINKILKQIQNKYKNKIELIEWSPRDKNGKIGYEQQKAHMDCLKKLKNDNVKWCANIDMDEFIVINNGNTNSIKDYLGSLDSKVSNVKMGQIRFETRFNNIGNLIINIKNNELKRENEYPDKYHSPKNIYRVKDTQNLSVHSWKGFGKQHHPNQNELCFNHYKINSKNYSNNNLKNFNNINLNIKNKIEKNSKNYI